MVRQLRVYRHVTLVAVFVLVVLSGAVSQRARADTYQVSASIHAPTSPYPAVITQPVSGSTVIGNAVQAVSGTCPVLSPQLIVLLWRDSAFLGSVPCGPGGTFSLNVTLLPGANTITPKLKNITNDPGVDGSPVTVTYSNASPVRQTITNYDTDDINKNRDTQSGSSLKLESEKEFLLVAPDGTVILTITIKDGKSPYVMTVDWGDGTSSTYRYKDAGKKTIEHKYKDNAAHTVTVRTTDKNGQVVSLVLGAVAGTPVVTDKKAAQPRSSSISKYVLISVFIAAISGCLYLFGARRRKTNKSTQVKVRVKSGSGKARVKKSKK